MVESVSPPNMPTVLKAIVGAYLGNDISKEPYEKFVGSSSSSEYVGELVRASPDIPGLSLGQINALARCKLSEKIIEDLSQRISQPLRVDYRLNNLSRLTCRICNFIICSFQKIFPFLSPITYSWYLAQIKPEIVNKITSLDLSGSEITDSELKSLLSKFPRLKRLDLSGCRQLTDAALIAVAQACPGLTHLNINKCDQFTDAALTAVAENCPGLTQLDIGGCDQFTDAALIDVAQRCPGLTHLNISWSHRFRDAALTAVAENCPGLTQLDIQECKWFADAAIARVREIRPGLEIRGPGRPAWFSLF